MGVREEIAAIRDGEGEPQEKARLIANLKATRLHQGIPSMSRPFQRDNIRFTMRSKDGFALEERDGVQMLRIVFQAQQLPNGPMLLEYDDPRNPHYFINPPIMVPDGEEEDPDNPGQMRPKFREDLLEAVRLMLRNQVR